MKILSNMIVMKRGSDPDYKQEVVAMTLQKLYRVWQVDSRGPALIQQGDSNWIAVHEA